METSTPVPGDSQKFPSLLYLGLHAAVQIAKQEVYVHMGLDLSDEEEGAA